MKRARLITATVILAALLPLSFFFFISRDYSPALTSIDGDFLMEKTPSRESSGIKTREASNVIAQEPQSSAGVREVSSASIRGINNAPAYRDSYDPEMMVKKPATGTLSAALTASKADDDITSSSVDTADASDLIPSAVDTFGVDPTDASSSNVSKTPSLTPSLYPENPQYVQTPASELTPGVTPALNYGAVNPLTGASFDAAWNPWDGNLNGFRPWAVSIGNTADAMPLWGIGSADILVEFVVESVATRFLAIYQDISSVGRIGGIRSLRSSSMEIAASFDAIFAHWGGRTYDNVVTNGSPVSVYDTIDASSLGSRDPSKVAPNNAVVNSGTELAGKLPSSFRARHCDFFRHGFSFTDVGTPLNGEHADTVTVSFSDRTAKKTIFSYDYYAGKYYVSQFGTDLVDGNNNEKLSFTNVLVIRTDMQFDCNESKHTYIRTTGTGTGYFINGRKYTPIFWTRDNVSSPYSFYLTDGTPLKLGVGKTYMCIVQSNQVPVFE